MFNVILGKNPPFIITKEALDIIKSQLERERIEKALKSSDRFSHDITLLFGFTLSEICNKIYPSPKEEIKMTREEAIKKLIKLIHKNFPMAIAEESAKHQVEILEALGLLKFEEEKDKVIKIDSTEKLNGPVYVSIKKAIEALHNAGYIVTHPLG